jgi:hypothetical protein
MHGQRVLRVKEAGILYGIYIGNEGKKLLMLQREKEENQYYLLLCRLPIDKDSSMSLADLKCHRQETIGRKSLQVEWVEAHFLGPARRGRSEHAGVRGLLYPYLSYGTLCLQPFPTVPSYNTTRLMMIIFSICYSIVLLMFAFHIINF